MKHTIAISLLMIGMFLAAQLIGLLVVNSFDEHFGKRALQEKKEQPDFSIVKEISPPPVELKGPVDIAVVITNIIFALIIATLVFFFLTKLRFGLLIKLWFVVVVFLCLLISFTLIFYYFFPSFIRILGKNIALAEAIALPLALLLTYYKIFKRDILLHNFSELFIYGGIASVFVSFLNVYAALFLLFAISVYDIYAVWHSKFMVKMAKFQINKLKIFTGFFVPYMNKETLAKLKEMKKTKGKNMKKVSVSLAILGGGDVAFPLIFAGTVLLAYGFVNALIVVLSTALALLFLLAFSEKGKFYPAMPFLTAGCILGLLLTLI